MTRFYLMILLTLLFVPLVVAGDPANPGKDAPKDPLPGVTANLVFSVDEYDPLKPSKGVVKCVVINKSADPVEVLIGIGNTGNGLMAQGKNDRWALTLLPSKKVKETPKRVKVKPGEEQVVFELSLDDILFQDVKKERAWKWDWRARPQPPDSPIHAGRTGFVEEATFWAGVIVNDTPLSSEKKVLKIKPSNPDAK